MINKHMNPTFLNNKYRKCYFSIIAKRLSSPILGYSEKHHIVPKSMGGDNTKSNLVPLSAREHYICHLLLIKMTIDENRVKMIRALNAFKIASRKNPRNLTARQYETIRKLTANMPGWNKGKTKKDYTLKQQAGCQKSSVTKKGKSTSMKGKHFNGQALINITLAAADPQRRIKISKKLKGRVSPTKGMTHPRSPCPHCQQLVAPNTMALYHGVRCKSIPNA